MVRKPSVTAALKLLKGKSLGDVAAGVAALQALGDPGAWDKVLEGVEVDSGGFSDGKNFRAASKATRPLRSHAVRALVAAAPAGTRAAGLRRELESLRVMSCERQGLLPDYTLGDQPADLAPLAAFPALTSLIVQGASSTANLEAVAALRSLARLSLWSVRGVPSLRPVGALSAL